MRRILAGVTIFEQVRREASSLKPARVAATLLLAIPVACGWCAGQVVRGLWRTFGYVWSALVVGYRTASRPKDV